MAKATKQTNATKQGEAATAKNLALDQRYMIATARNDITIPNFSTVLSPLDDTLIERGGGKGLKIYDEIERDTFAYAVLQKRKFALVGRDWIVEPASDDAADAEVAEFIEKQLQRINFDQLCLDLLDATLKGFAVAEVCWKKDGSAIVPERIIAHDPRRFAFDENWKPRLLTMSQMINGEELPERKFIIHRFGVKGNNPHGIGIGSKLFWPVLFKREGVTFWLTLLEKFSSPTPVGFYPEGMLPGEQLKLLDRLMGIRQSGALIMPMGGDAKFLEASRNGSVSYAEWCQYWDTQMAICVFGSNLGTQIDGQGARAASETHHETEEQIVDADGDLLSNTLQSSLIQWLVDYNFPGRAVPSVRRPRPQNDMATEDLRKKRADNAKSELENLFNVAGKIPAEKLAEVAAAFAGIDLLPNIPDEVLKQIAPHIAKARDNLAAAARNGSLPIPENENDPAAAKVRAIAFAAGHDHGIAQLADQALALGEPFIGAWIDTLRTAMEKAERDGKTLGDFADDLLAIQSELTVDALGNVIAPALALSDLTGRADVSDEIKGRK